MRTGAFAAVLLAVLALDVVISAAIFLIIPTILGEIDDFWPALLFRGERPWLGLLFWTTFSTSVLLWLFIAAALLARPLALLSQKLQFAYNLQEHPIRCISVAMAGGITPLFAIGAILLLIAG